jgi:hypothetical protein
VLIVKKVIELAKKLNLQFEEIMFLYSVYQRNEYPEDTEFRLLISEYYSRFQYYNKGEGETPIPILWVDMVKRLVKQGFVESLEKEDTKTIDLSKLRVTDKFVKVLTLEEDEDYWWEQYVKLWEEFSPKHDKLGYAYVIGTTHSILLPDKDNKKVNTIENMKKYFWKDICQCGQKYSTGELFTYTEMYLKSVGPNKKISTFLLSYPQLKLQYNEFRRTKE